MIQSEQNQWLKKIKSLQQKKYREQYGQFVAEGLRFVQEAIAHQAEIEMILVSESHWSVVNEQGGLGQGLPVVMVKGGLLEKALNTVTPQGVAAIVGKPQFSLDQLAQMKTILVVDGVQDPGNLGTILRTALASHTQGVFCLRGTVDLFNDKVLRSTMGAIFNIPVYLVEDHHQLVAQLHQLGFKLVVADIRGEQYYYQYPFPAKTALVVGNEGNGPQLIVDGDDYVKIPLHPQSESLNVAIATGILLYEIQRQKNNG